MFTLTELVQQKRQIEAEIAERKQQLDSVMAEIELAVGAKLAEVRKLQGKEFGAVNVTADGFKVTETVPKKVSWCQEKMLDIFGRILASGDRPENYLRMELSVPEKLYDGFAPEVRTLFDEARTVAPGKTKIEIEEVAG